MDPQLKRQFALLGLTPESSHSEIRTAYKRRAAQLHPDRTGGTTTEQFQALREAYQAVMQFHKRQQAFLKERAQHKQGQQSQLNRQRLAKAYQQHNKSSAKGAKPATSSQRTQKTKAGAPSPGRAGPPGNSNTRQKSAPKKVKKPNYWLWCLIIVGLLLIALSLWQYQHQPPPPVKVLAPVPSHQAPDISLTPPPGHRISYPQLRSGDHYSLNFAPLYERPPTADTPPLPELLAPPLQPIEVIEAVGDGWLRVAFANRRFYTREHLIGYGDPALAERFGCNRYPLPRPQSGEVVSGASGKRQLQVANPQEHDALISFIDSKQQLLQQVYLRSEDRIMLHQVPGNSSQVQIEYGRFYNKSCGHFTAERSIKKLKISLLGGWQLLELP